VSYLAVIFRLSPHAPPLRIGRWIRIMPSASSPTSPMFRPPRFNFLRKFHSSALRYAASPKPAHGFTPPTLNDNVHMIRCLAQLRSKDKAIEKNIYLSQLKNADEHMFYRIYLAHMEEITPLIYTPTIGDACLQYSANYRRPEGMVGLMN
jgi:hypothetical protein